MGEMLKLGILTVSLLLVQCPLFILFVCLLVLNTNMEGMYVVLEQDYMTFLSLPSLVEVALMMADKQRAESEGEDLPLAKFTLTLSLYFPPNFLLLFATRTLVWNALDSRQNGVDSKQNCIFASSQVASAIEGPTQSQLGTIHGLGREFFTAEHSINLSVSQLGG